MIDGPCLTLMQRFNTLLQQFMVLGHLAAVFCVLFDHTGRCIITVSLHAVTSVSGSVITSCIKWM